tara:strand:+ start:1917 stop:2096 length:180 start_codon:yes stop_codon:yes gene_type:complete
MKEIKNDSMQSWDVFLRTPKGVTPHWLQPGEHLVVPASYITDQIETLHRRKIIKITNAS